MKPPSPLFLSVILSAAISATRGEPASLLDPSFDVGTGPTTFLPRRIAFVNSIVAQNDGKLLISGHFTEVNGVPRKSIARLHPDGSVDREFHPSLNLRDEAARTVALQPDGRILVFGEVLDVNNVNPYGAVRLNQDGLVEHLFAQPHPFTLSTAWFRGALLPKGKLLFIGRNLQSCAGYQLFRLNPGGSSDETLTERFLCLPGSRLGAIVGQEDGKLLISGNFLQVRGAARRGLARLNADGSLDASFDPGHILWPEPPEEGLDAILVQPDGRILIAGCCFQTGNRPAHSLARLHPDGTMDENFMNNVVATGRADRRIRALALDPQGRILAGGEAALVRFLPDGKWDPAFDSSSSLDNISVQSLAVQPDGKVLAGSHRLNDQSAIARLLEENPTIGVEFRSSEQRHNEALEGATLVVDRKGDLDVTVTVEYSVVGGTATAGVDYQLPAGQLVFQPRETSKMISIFTMDDGADEADETVIIALRNPTSGAVLGARRNARLTIEDDERPGGTDPNWAFSCFLGFCGPSQLIPESDGRLLALSRGSVRRIDSEGRFDSRLPDASTSLEIWTMARQEDGRVIVGGNFSSLGGVPRAGLARVNADGSLDTTFDPGAGISPLGFEDSGTADFEPDPPSPASISTLAPLRDGKILVGGGFLNVGGIRRPGLARLNPDGSVDQAFDAALKGTAGYDRLVSRIIVQPDGRILLNGSFQSVGRLARNGLARLKEDGSADATFSPGLESYPVKLLALEPAGTLLVYAQSSPILGRVLRLREDGSIDDTFVVRAERLRSCCESDPLVAAAAIQVDGGILLTGTFNKLNGVALPGLARLESDGALDPSFQPSSTPLDGTGIVLQENGQILVLAGTGRVTRINGVSKELKFRPVEISSSGHVRLRLATQPAQRYLLQSSTDLRSWLPIHTSTATGRTLEFEDTDAPNHPRRFYRARLLP